MQSRSTGRSVTLIIVGVLVIVGSIFALVGGGQVLWWLALAAGIIAAIVGILDLAQKRGRGTDPRA
ncbi:hypothetical protein N3K63_13965 [Microbacterium sp. W1N]|uniref:hypothetical protein n=1 Tax=Microbacterium festucae TaxID=2977531 RepID=UPI0021C168BB|nr:hypothetical protein [Microbacterium festucae]MCT9821386.1 hypothetical protein [Microbacterium festucae]